LAVLCGMHHRYFRRLEARHSPDLGRISDQSGLPAAALAAVGDFHVNGDRRDLRSLSRTHAGTTRVAALGDSFVYGDEVTDGLEYPARLRRILESNQITNVEIVNLGSSWYGFAQTVRLWELYGRDLSPDFLLVGPQTLYYERDSTFNHADDYNPYYLHGRYVFEDGALRFIDVLGAELDAHDRFRRYNAFIPPWRYLRYDRNAPAFLRALLPEGRRLVNPFYYWHGSADDERDVLYAALLRKLAESGSQVIVAHSDKSLAELAGRSDPRVIGIHVPHDHRFPRARTNGHYACDGNDRLARVFFDAITGKQESKNPRIAVRISDAASGATRTLERLGTCEVRADGRRAAHLFYVRPGPEDGWDELLDLSAARFPGLLSIHSADDSFLDGYYYPLARPIGDGTEAVLYLTYGEAEREMWRGKVRQLPGGLAISVLAIPGLTSDVRRLRVAAGALAKDQHASKGGRLVVAGQTVARIEPGVDRVLELVSPLGRLSYMRPAENTETDVMSWAASGSIDLVCSGGGRARVATYTRETETISWHRAPAVRRLVGP
jgi:hypothetical protein